MNKYSKYFTTRFICIWVVCLVFDILLTFVTGYCLYSTAGTAFPVWFRHGVCFLMVGAWCVVLLLLRYTYRSIVKPLAAIEDVLHGIGHARNEVGGDSIRESGRIGLMYKEVEHLEDTIREMAENEAKAIFMRKQAELSVLQSQINPHFLYNTLETIRGQAIVYGITDIEVMTRALANLFRYSINSKDMMVTLSQELSNVENYFLIQKCRFGDKFTKEERIDEDTRDCMLPKLLIQPLVENAVHHGLERKIGKGKLTISAYRTQKDLIIHIIDDGIGISEEKLFSIRQTLRQSDPGKILRDDRGHIGIINVHDRIRLTYGEPYGISLFSEPNVGTDIEVTLPAICEFRKK